MACPSEVNVRNAQFAAPPLFTQVGGVHGTITSGPVSGGVGNPFYTGNWWQINWDSEPPNQNGIQGWSAEFAIVLAPSAGDVPQPTFASRYYTADNRFFPAYAPNSIGGSAGALGNCTWYAYGRLRELGYNSTQLNAMLGNAGDWATEAVAAGIPVDNNPTVGSIAQVNSGSFSSLGHVAVVESVNTDGTITVTESSYSTDTTSVWNFLWRHRTVSPTWFSNFIHVSNSSNPTAADLRDPDALTIDEIRNILNTYSDNLRGKEQLFWDLAHQHRVNPLLVIGIYFFESELGNTGIGRPTGPTGGCYNPGNQRGGNEACPSEKNGNFRRFFNYDEAITETFRLLEEFYFNLGFLTVDQVIDRYDPPRDPAVTSNISNNINEKIVVNCTLARKIPCRQYP